MVYSNPRLNTITMAKLSQQRAFPSVPCINVDCPSVNPFLLPVTDTLSWVSAEESFMCQICGVRQMPKQILFSQKRSNELTSFGIALKKAIDHETDNGLEIES